MKRLICVQLPGQFDRRRSVNPSGGEQVSATVDQPYQNLGEGGGFPRVEISENLGASGVKDSSLRQRNCPIVDVGLTVRKWNVSFSGGRGQSIKAFLERVEACRGSTSLSEAEVFQALPELLKGVAAMWF